MIDIDRLEKSVAKVVSLSVGDMLATIEGSLADVPDDGNGNIPAVLLERNIQKDGSHRKPNIPDYPYCSVTYNRIVDDVSEVVNIFLRDDEQVYQTNKIVSMNIKFYGNRKNSADSIANRMHMSWEVENFRVLLEKFYGQEVAVRNKSDVVPSNVVYQDTYIEMRTFDIFLSVVDEYTISTDVLGYFDQIVVDSDLNILPPVPPDSGLPAQEASEGGELDHYEDDPAPMAVTFRTTNNN